MNPRRRIFLKRQKKKRSFKVKQSNLRKNSSGKKLPIFLTPKRKPSLPKVARRPPVKSLTAFERAVNDAHSKGIKWDPKDPRTLYRALGMSQKESIEAEITRLAGIEQRMGLSIFGVDSGINSLMSYDMEKRARRNLGIRKKGST